MVSDNAGNKGEKMPEPLADAVDNPHVREPEIIDSGQYSYPPINRNAATNRPPEATPEVIDVTSIPIPATSALAQALEAEEPRLLRAIETPTVEETVHYPTYPKPVPHSYHPKPVIPVQPKPAPEVTIEPQQKGPEEHVADPTVTDKAADAKETVKEETTEQNESQEIRDARQDYEANKSFIDCNTSCGFADEKKALEWIIDKIEVLTLLSGKTLSYRDVALMLWVGDRLVKRSLEGEPERKLSRKRLLECCEFTDKLPWVGVEALNIWNALDHYVVEKVRKRVWDPMADKLRHNKARKMYQEAMNAKSKKDYGLAINRLSQALEIDSRFAQAYIERGRIWAHYWDYDQAIADIKKAMELDPGSRIAKDTLTAIMMAKERDEAREDKLADTPTAKPQADAPPKSARTAQDEENEKPALLTELGKKAAIAAAYTLGALAIAGAGYGAWSGFKAVSQHYSPFVVYTIEQAGTLTDSLRSRMSTFRKKKTQKTTWGSAPAPKVQAVPAKLPQAKSPQALQDAQSRDRQERTKMMESRARTATRVRATRKSNAPRNHLPRKRRTTK